MTLNSLRRRATGADAPVHRYAVTTTDFTTSDGTVMTAYSVASYGVNADAAAAKALEVIAMRYAPAVMPTVTGTSCDMGCISLHD